MSHVSQWCCSDPGLWIALCLCKPRCPPSLTDKWAANPTTVSLCSGLGDMSGLTVGSHTVQPQVKIRDFKAELPICARWYCKCTYMFYKSDYLRVLWAKDYHYYLNYTSVIQNCVGEDYVACILTATVVFLYRKIQGSYLFKNRGQWFIYIYIFYKYRVVMFVFISDNTG